MQEKEAEADPNGENMQMLQKATVITVHNKGSKPIRIVNYRVWLGNGDDAQVVVQIPVQGSDQFTFLGDSHGTMAGIQYNGDTISGVECGLKVAWFAPTVYDPPSIPNRVVTYANTRELTDKHNWNDMTVELATASSTAPHASIVHQEPDTASLVVNVNMDRWF
ncbi:hypothetical protein KSS87_018878 [Heliosperma pusillum]|nr:hypothetical protein KSS87_018878 [Heliosperma pusillum]